jgi:hypothetical protein
VFRVVVESVSRLIPNEFEETYLRVFTRHVWQKDIVDRAFQQVRKKKRYIYLIVKVKDA